MYDESWLPRIGSNIRLLLVELTGTAQQADITADTRQPAFIVHTSPQFSRILVF